MNLSNAIDGYLMFKSTRCTTATITIDRVQFNQFLNWYGDRGVLDLTSQDVVAYLLHEEERGLSPHTRLRQLSILSSLYRWLSAPEIGLAPLGHNPTTSVQAPKLPKLQPKALNETVIKALLAATKTGRNQRRDRALVLFLTDTCARSTETCRVQVGDVDLKSGRVLVLGKGTKERYVYLGNQAQSAVWLYITSERPRPRYADDDTLFLSKGGYPFERKGFRHVIIRLAERAGVQATPHAFRHTGAIQHLRNGMDLVSLQHLLGHSNISTTRMYLTALADEDVGKKAQRTSPSDNWRL